MTKLFELLDITVNVDDPKFDAQLKRGYQKKSIRYHPDKTNSTAGHDAFNFFTRLKDFLSDPLCRDYYIKNPLLFDELPQEEQMKMFDKISLQYGTEAKEKNIENQAWRHFANFSENLPILDEQAFVTYVQLTIEPLENQIDPIQIRLREILIEYKNTMISKPNTVFSLDFGMKKTYKNLLDFKKSVELNSNIYPSNLFKGEVENGKELLKKMYDRLIQAHISKILSAYEKASQFIRSSSASQQEAYELLLANSDDDNRSYLQVAYDDLMSGTSSYGVVNDKPVNHAEVPVVSTVSELDAARVQCYAHIEQILEGSTTVLSRFQQIQQAEQTLNNIEGFSAEYKRYYCNIMNFFRNSLSDSIHTATQEFKNSDIYRNKTTSSVDSLQLLCDKVENLNQNALYNNLYPKRLFSPDSPISYLDASNRLLAYNGLLIDHQANIVNSYKEINQLLNQGGNCLNVISSKSDFLRDYSQQAHDDSIKIRKSYNLKVDKILLMADYRYPMRGVYSIAEMHRSTREQTVHETQRVIPNLAEGIEFLTRYIRQDDGKSNLASYSNDKEKTCYKELEKIPAKDRLCFAYLYLNALIKRQQELQDKYSEKITPRADETKSEQVIKETEAQQQAAREEAARQQALQQAAREEAARQQALQQAAREEAARQQAQQQAAREEAARQQAQQQAAREEAARQQALQQALQQAAREEAARQSDEAWNKEIALKNMRRQELIIINNELTNLKIEVNRLGNIGQSQIKTMKTICDNLDNCNFRYLEGEWDKLTYVNNINTLINQKNTLAVFSKHEGWLKPIAVILANIVIAACGLLTFSASMFLSHYCIGSIFYHPKTPSQVILASLQDTINQLNDIVNDTQSPQYTQ